MRNPPNVAVGRAASDATTAEPSVFVAGSLASQSPKVACRSHADTTSMHIHASCNQPTSKTHQFSIRGLEGGKSQLTSWVQTFETGAGRPSATRT